MVSWMRHDLGIKLKNGKLSGVSIGWLQPQVKSLQYLETTLVVPTKDTLEEQWQSCVPSIQLTEALAWTIVEKWFKRILKLLTKLSGKQWGQGSGEKKVEL